MGGAGSMKGKEERYLLDHCCIQQENEWKIRLPASRNGSPAGQLFRAAIALQIDTLLHKRASGVPRGHFDLYRTQSDPL